MSDEEIKKLLGDPNAEKAREQRKAEHQRAPREWTLTYRDTDKTWVIDTGEQNYAFEDGEIVLAREVKLNETE